MIAPRRRIARGPRWATGQARIGARHPITEVAPLSTQTRETLTVEEAAEVLGVGRSAAYEAVRRGEIPALRIGRRFVIPRVALDRMLSCDDEGEDR